MRLFGMFRAFCIFALLAQASCGSIDERQSELDDRDRQTRLITVMGGYNSCGDAARQASLSPFKMDMFKPFKKIFDQLRGSGVPSEYVISCFKDEDNLVYSTSQSKGKEVSANIEEFSSFMKESRGESDKLTMVGHSYGGWLMMKLAVDRAESWDVDSIFSIDPISRSECTFSNPANCTSAPRDISEDQYAQLAASVGNFQNFYQTRTFYLHSGPIKHASKNTKLNETHTSIDTAEEIWQNIDSHL